MVDREPEMALPHGASRRRRLLVPQVEDVEGGYPLAFPAEPQTAQVLGDHESHDGLVRCRVHEDLSRPGCRLQTSGHVDGIAHDGVVHASLRADVAGQYLPAGDTDP